jgi:hypothetical protein
MKNFTTAIQDINERFWNRLEEKINNYLFIRASEPFPNQWDILCCLMIELEEPINPNEAEYRLKRFREVMGKDFFPIIKDKTPQEVCKLVQQLHQTELGKIIKE